MTASILLAGARSCSSTAARQQLRAQVLRRSNNITLNRARRRQLRAQLGRMWRNIMLNWDYSSESVRCVPPTKAAQTLYKNAPRVASAVKSTTLMTANTVDSASTRRNPM